MISCSFKMSDFEVSIDFSPRGSSKRVSRSTRWRVGSLVPQISLSVMMTWESSVSHSPGPSCVQKDILQLTHNQITVKTDDENHNHCCYSFKYNWLQCVQLQPAEWQTSFDCRMLLSGIHTVPTIVSQINPLFHISTVRPRSRRLISLQRETKVRKLENQEERGCGSGGRAVIYV